jgi:RecB family endonuclease NucS
MMKGQRRPAPVSKKQAEKLAILLDAVGWIRITDAEQASLEWLSGFEAATVENIAAVIRRARAS